MRRINRDNDDRKIVIHKKEDIHTWFINEDPQLILNAIQVLDSYNLKFHSSLDALYLICETYDFNEQKLTHALQERLQ